MKNTILAILILLLGIPETLLAASRYFVNGGVDNNWGSTANWSLTSGGGGGQTVPTSSDDVHFDANSPNCTVNSSGRAAFSLDFTGYGSTGSRTITMTQNITVSGSVTLVTTMTVAGSGTLLINGSGTLTSNGKVWPNAMQISGSITSVLADDWFVSGLVTYVSGSLSTVLNGSTGSQKLRAAGGFRYSGTSGSGSGTGIIELAGTGTVDAPSVGANNGNIRNPIHINAPGGTITITSGKFLADLNQLKYVAGTVVTSAGTWATSGGGNTQRAYPLTGGQ